MIRTGKEGKFKKGKSNLYVLSPEEIYHRTNELIKSKLTEDRIGISMDMHGNVFEFIGNIEKTLENYPLNKIDKNDTLNKNDILFIKEKLLGNPTYYKTGIDFPVEIIEKIQEADGFDLLDPSGIALLRFLRTNLKTKIEATPKEFVSSILKHVVAFGKESPGISPPFVKGKTSLYTIPGIGESIKKRKATPKKTPTKKGEEVVLFSPGIGEKDIEYEKHYYYEPDPTFQLYPPFLFSTLISKELNNFTRVFMTERNEESNKKLESMFYNYASIDIKKPFAKTSGTFTNREYISWSDMKNVIIGIEDKIKSEYTDIYGTLTDKETSSILISKSINDVLYHLKIVCILDLLDPFRDLTTYATELPTTTTDLFKSNVEFNKTAEGKRLLYLSEQLDTDVYKYISYNLTKALKHPPNPNDPFNTQIENSTSFINSNLNKLISDASELLELNESRIDYLSAQISSIIQKTFSDYYVELEIPDPFNKPEHLLKQMRKVVLYRSNITTEMEKENKKKRKIENQINSLKLMIVDLNNEKDALYLEANNLIDHLYKENLWAEYQQAISDVKEDEIVHAGIATAYNLVRESFSGVWFGRSGTGGPTLEQMQNDPIMNEMFADLVAFEISRTRHTFPIRWQSKDTPKNIVNKFRTVLKRMLRYKWNGSNFVLKPSFDGDPILTAYADFRSLFKTDYY